MTNGRLRAALSIAVAGGAAVLFVQSAFPDEGPRALLPDIQPVAPYRANVVTAQKKGGFRYLLAFPSISENIGDGPLEIEATRKTRRDKTMTAAQLVERSDGTKRRYRRVGTLRFERSPDHSHWHFKKFMIYELHHASDYELVGPDVKTGFCLGDRHRIKDRRIEGAARDPRFVVNCGKGKPRLLRVREGISVGWYDNYEAYLEGQYIDVSAVPDGRYVLVHRSNPSRRVRETSYENNSSSALLELRRPEGDDRPRVEILKRCLAEPRCG